ncbi:hypothetical protein [uncultured Ruminococcus sp.]|uniref:hypothetical protein n=1 Tax=uncultured Ruminococcus sp. TaxID=165186 RepID=UPI0025DA1A5F|nr:hypothetical protein [uncultured Ruminococcus sp.]
MNKKATYINLAAQCVLCISVAVFSFTNIMDIELPDAVIIILMVLDLLTIPAFMYAYVKSMEGDSK